MPNDPNPPAEDYADPLDVHRALHRTLIYGIVPLWIVPGFLDYIAHKRSKIEDTAGTHESLLHTAQMMTLGLPITMALLFRVNAAVIAPSIGAVLLHEVLTLWDVAYAQARRPPSPNEQHIHSFLESTPVAALISILALHPRETASVFGRGTLPPEWRLRGKEPPLAGGYLAAVFGAVGVFLVLPYAEELVRCWRKDRTIAPRPAPERDERNGSGAPDARAA